MEGRDSYTIKANAIYTQTGAQSRKNNAGVVEQTIAAQVRNGNGSLRMSEERQLIPERKMLALRFEACSALALNNQSESRNDIWS